MKKWSFMIPFISFSTHKLLSQRWRWINIEEYKNNHKRKAIKQKSVYLHLSFIASWRLSFMDKMIFLGIPLMNMIIWSLLKVLWPNKSDEAFDEQIEIDQELDVIKFIYIYRKSYSRSYYLGWTFLSFFWTWPRNRFLFL